MKGLLHRLAARAAGSAITVRSDARLPFANPRTRASAVEPTIEPSLTNRDVAPAIGATDPSTAALEAAPAIGATDPSTAALEAAPAPVPMMVAPPSPVSARQTVSVEAAGEVRAVRADPLSGTFEARIPPRLVESEPAGLEPGIPSPDRAPAQQPAPAPSQERVAAPSREPTLLMPETAAGPPPRSPPLAPATTCATAGGMHPVTGDEPNEVHIHIGRIEVTAVHESAAPRRRAAAPTAAPMSLQEYFAKRGRT